MSTEVIEPTQRLSASDRIAHSNSLAIAWTMAALVGAAAISVFSGQTALRLLAPLGIMATYVFFGVNSPGRNTTKLADSVYFLGFLWTLYALINEFVFRRSSVMNADSVYRVFGYALVTTAFGMFVRLALLQFHHTASDQMEEARDDLDIHIEVLSRELVAAHRDLTTWRSTAAASLLAFDEELERAQKGVAARIEVVHRDAAGALVETIKNAVIPISAELNNIAAVSRRMRTAVETLDTVTALSTEGIMNAGATFSAKLAENGETLDRTLGASLARAGAALETAATNMAAAVSKQGEAAVRSLDAVSEAANAFATKLGQGSEVLEKTMTGTLARAGTTLESAAAGYATTIAKQGQATVEVFHATSQAVVHMVSPLRDVQTSVGDIQQRLQEIPRAITNSAGTIEEAGANSAARIESAANQTTAAISTAKDAAVALNKTVEEVLEFVRKRVV